MRLVDWFAHIIVFGHGSPHLFMENLPFKYENPYGHPMDPVALLLPSPSIALSRPGADEEIQLSAETQYPWDDGSGDQPFARFVQSSIAPGEVNDRYQGLVSGEIEFHCPDTPEKRLWIRNCFYHPLQYGFAVVRCDRIALVKRLGYFRGNRDVSVPPWYE